MFLEQFLDVLGLATEDVDDLWPEDRRARKEGKTAQLQKSLQEKKQALIRRRHAIERLRWRLEHTTKDSYRARYQEQLAMREHQYQSLLGSVRLHQRRLRRLQLG
jgi:hypothetical protein